MGEAIFDHLWQSTLCVVSAAILTLIVRKDSARVRFLIWFGASAKFLVPCSLLISAGGLIGSKAPAMWHMSPTFASAMAQFASPAAMLVASLAATPLAGAPHSSHWSSWSVFFIVWVVGFVFIILRRTAQWLRLHAIARASTPLDINAPIPVHETASPLEPGVFGIVSPVVLVPAGVAAQLGPAQLHAILAHELCHWRHKDNLTAAIHGLVECLFWFHPLVWWLGTQMVAERERACDESVIQSGNDRRTYAEGILKVCRLYVSTPPCSAGVSGGGLRKRIEEIMQNVVIGRLSWAKRTLLVAAASVVIAAPVAVGIWGAPDVARAEDADSATSKHYASAQWKFALDIPGNWHATPPESATSAGPGAVMTFWPAGSRDRLMILSRHPYDPNKDTLNAVLASAQQDMAKTGFRNFVQSAPFTIGSKRAIRLDFERAPKDGEGVWYCRNYYIVGAHSAYLLAFGARNITAAQRDAVLKSYDRVAVTFTFQDL